MKIDSSFIIPEVYASTATFPAAGVASKIYIAADTNLLYRWNGTAYVTVVGVVSNAELTAEAVFYSAIF